MTNTEPLRPAGLYLRDTWARRVQDLLVALILLCFSAALLGLALWSVLEVIAAIAHNYITWGLAGYLLVAVFTGSGTVVFARGFSERAWHAVGFLPAEYGPAATGAAPRKLET